MGDGMINTRAKNAAKMRLEGMTITQVAEHFGWSYRTASTMISRGKRDNSTVHISKPRSTHPIELPSRDFLCEKFVYDAETGNLKRAIPGDKPSGSLTRTGYVAIHAGGKARLAHRVIWKMVYGTEPQQIDHINGVRSDNRLSNLRASDHSDNKRNQKLSVRNKSGRIGVNYIEYLGKWRAFIGINGKAYHLGLFKTMEDAATARAAAEIKYGFSERHGTRR